VPAHLRDAEGRVAGLRDDEGAPVQAAWVQPGLTYQSADRGLVTGGGSPDPVLHELILAAHRSARAAAPATRPFERA
jgi:hypothetical protein